MKTTNEIMSYFGNNSKYISINFVGSEWNASYDDKLKSSHTESAPTIEEAVEKLYKWYSERRNPKNIAVELYTTLLNIHKIVNDFRSSDNSADLNYMDTFDEISELCCDGIGLLNFDKNGNAVWNEPLAVETKPMNAPVQKQSSAKAKKSPKEEPVKKITESTDGLPLYFEVKTPSFMFVRCYGYDVNGERVFINIDMQDYKNTTIESGVTLDPAKFPSDAIIPIAEDEFNSRYDEATVLMLNATNYQPIDYSNVEIIK